MHLRVSDATDMQFHPVGHRCCTSSDCLHTGPSNTPLVRHQLMSHRNKTLISTVQSLSHDILGLIVPMPLDHYVIDLCKCKQDIFCVDTAMYVKL